MLLLPMLKCRFCQISNVEFSHNGQSAVATCHEWRCAFPVAFNVGEVKRLSVYETASCEDVVHIKLAVLRLYDAEDAVAVVDKAQQTVWRPSYLYNIACCQIVAHQLVGIEE